MRKMDNRFNIGSEVRELKLGSTFTSAAPSKGFHTIKYDFKPASVDVNKPATLAVSPNKQVTVTVPHLDGSGVPNTVFKGSQRDYSKKECVLIVNRTTGEITLEQLNSNIQVKKTRIENKVVNPPPPPPTMKVENNTARQSSKTKITTGVRKNTPISFVPKHSPLQGSPSYPHKSPQSAPAWNANNTQQTLPSIPIIGLDDGVDFPSVSASSVPLIGGSNSIAAALNSNHHHTNSLGTVNSSSNNNNNNSSSNNNNNNINSISNNHSLNNNHSNNSVNNHSNHNNNNNHNSYKHLSDPNVEVSLPPARIPPASPPRNEEFPTALISSSDSDLSDSDSSNSDSDSDSTTEDNNDSPVKDSIFDLGRPEPPPAVQGIKNPILPMQLLSDDLCLSSNSDDDDDD